MTTTITPVHLLLQQPPLHPLLHPPLPTPLPPRPPTPPQVGTPPLEAAPSLPAPAVIALVFASPSAPPTATSGTGGTADPSAAIPPPLPQSQLAPSASPTPAPCSLPAPTFKPTTAATPSSNGPSAPKPQTSTSASATASACPWSARASTGTRPLQTRSAGVNYAPAIARPMIRTERIAGIRGHIPGMWLRCLVASWKALGRTARKRKTITGIMITFPSRPFSPIGLISFAPSAN